MSHRYFKILILAISLNILCSTTRADNFGSSASDAAPQNGALHNSTLRLNPAFLVNGLCVLGTLLVFHRHVHRKRRL